METSNEVTDLLNKRKETPPVQPAAEQKVSSSIAEQSTTNFWGGAKPEFEEPAKPAQEAATENKETTATTDPTKQVTPTPAGLPEKVLRNSASVTVSAIEMPVKVIGGAALWFQLERHTKKKFNGDKDLIAKALDLAEGDQDPADAQERAIKKRMLALIKKHAKKEEGLPFTETERETMEEAFYQQYKVSQKTMDPSTLIICSLTAAIGARAFDIATGW